VRGSAHFFREVVDSRKWGQRTAGCTTGVLEPRLTAPWNVRSGVPLEPRILEDVRLALSRVTAWSSTPPASNLYPRRPRDSVAWHGDRIAKEIEEPIVALVSLGEPRKFLSARGAAVSRAPSISGRRLAVTGGWTQRAWEHSVPKVAEAGPRISVAYRYGMATGKAASDEY